MGTAELRRHADGVPRLLVFWTRPYHLTRVEADAWVRSEVSLLEGAAGVEHARVDELHPASVEHPAPWHWMLEIHIADGATVARCVHRGPLADWLRDLRLLGMRPTVVVVAGDAAPREAA
jgi:hypothetical protein